jgi:hypothetical protein
MFEDYPTFIVKVLYNILFFIIFYIIIEYIIAEISYSPFIRWWKDNDGKKEVIDFTSLALYNRNKLTYDLYKEYLITNQSQLDETSILFIQNVLLNKTYSIEPTTGNILPGRFLKPAHMYGSIAWGEQDAYLWDNIDFSNYQKNNWYQWISENYDPTSKDYVVPGPTDSSWAGCSYSGGTSPAIGVQARKNIYTDNTAGGFWPSDYGCINFFDIPPIDPTDTSNPNDPELKPYDVISNLPCVGQDMYIPGYPGKRGSWAQLFADWGIVYTIKSKKGTSNIPVMSDGLVCKDLYPCTSYCGDSTSGLKCGDPTPGGYNCTQDQGTPTNYPTSNLTLWVQSGINGKNGQPGLNFFSAYNIYPESFLLTSWVAGYYNDSSVKKMIFDSYCVQNLLGIGTFGEYQGGWLRFLKGINTKIKSYDEITNELFRQYISKISPNLTPPPDPKCKQVSETARWFNIFKQTAAGFMLGPEFAIIGAPLAFAYALYNNAPSNC